MLALALTAAVVSLVLLDLRRDRVDPRPLVAWSPWALVLPLAALGVAAAAWGFLDGPAAFALFLAASLLFGACAGALPVRVRVGESGLELPGLVRRRGRVVPWRDVAEVESRPLWIEVRTIHGATLRLCRALDGLPAFALWALACLPPRVLMREGSRTALCSLLPGA